MSVNFPINASEALSQAGISSERFRAISAHLMSLGILIREEDKSEQGLYDDARRIESVLFDSLAAFGMTLHHDLDMQTFRLYPPGASAVGVTMVDEGGDGTKGMRQRLSQDFVAAALALRSLYEERLHRGAVGANGEALITLEDLSACMSGQLRRSLPATQGGKTDLIAELKRNRMIRTNSSFTVQDPDAFLAIRPYIVHLVSNDALSAAVGKDDASSPAPATAA